MFQTEPILFLQSFSNNLLDTIFIIITGLGDKDMAQLFLIVIIFGIDYRKGFILLHLVIWTAFATSVLKDFFALPRPFYVDSAVRAIGRNVANPTPLKVMGADTFWGLPDNAVIEYVRTHRMGSYGFPSGHTSGTVAMWGGVMFLFQKKWPTLAGGLLLALIPFSRIYLGRHFLADVLGGYMLGGFLLWVIYHVSAGRTAKNFLFSSYHLFASNRETIFLLGYLFGLPFLILLIFRSHSTYPALLLGLNLGFFLVRLKGLPDDSGSVFRRMMRVSVAGLIFLMTDYLLNVAFKTALSGSSVFIAHARPILLMACFAWAATEINILLGLMKRGKQ
ncbi:MAG: phosphatase PAP2 family protein [Desulfobacteraceae bacterium]|nr:phosphatase PAP2 family protein [Desulfobacteraceae bacterium]MBC2757969.1 phosphatase PAP2 family protein [Desulfobacteraceae bacterium]